MKVNPVLIFGTTDQYEQLQGRLFMLLSRAIQKSGESAYQPPHWGHTPSSSELDLEELDQENCERAGREVERCAKEIYELLTGVKLNA